MRIIYMIDFNCPYSYIGLERIKKAAETVGTYQEPFDDVITTLADM